MTAKLPVIALIGNPNCGKTTLFNYLTKTQQKTGNWQGVTVEKKIGICNYQGLKHKIVDLPGIYSLNNFSSPDEKITHDYVLANHTDIIINVLDASHIERNLYLTIQLLEIGNPLIIVLNMMDIAKRRGIKIDIPKLRQQFKCPIIPLIASKSKNDIAKILNTLTDVNDAPLKIYSNDLNQYIHKIEKIITPLTTKNNLTYWLAIRTLEVDNISLTAEIKTQVNNVRANLEKKLQEETDIIFADKRYNFINQLSTKIITRKLVGQTISEKIDKIVLNRYLSLPIFLLIMYGVFAFSINIGQWLQEYIQYFFTIGLVDNFMAAFKWLNIPEWLIGVTTGINIGITTVAGFIPLIATLFLSLSILEDSGYMARATILVDRIMHKIGLPGKSFIPLIVGFGCNVPAIMATRILSKERDRKISMIMNPFMSCGARLQVFSMLTMIFFINHGSLVIFGLYLLGIIVAIFTALIMKYTLLPGKVSPLIMELPVYQLPNIFKILHKTWHKLYSFIFRAGKNIILLAMLITCLGMIDTNGDFSSENQESSLLGSIAKIITPIFKPMGLHEENWPATIGILTGIFAKETVAGTLNTMYKIQSPDNSHTKIQEMFGSIYAVLAYMIFILMYIPCVSVMGVIKKEAGNTWMWFSIFWTTFLAYTLATIFYQSMTFILHPWQSVYWISSLLLSTILIIISLHFIGKLTYKENSYVNKSKKILI